MHLAELLKELRLMKGQAGYRYCLAWLTVLIHIGARPTATVFLAWLAFGRGLDPRLASAMLSVIPYIGRSMGT